MGAIKIVTMMIVEKNSNVAEKYMPIMMSNSAETYIMVSGLFSNLVLYPHK